MKNDEEMYRECSIKRARLNFLQLSPRERQAARGRVQEIVSREIARGQKTPSALARALANGAYDEPKIGELARLESWSRGEYLTV